MKNTKLQKRIDNFIQNATYYNTDGLINGSIYYTENPINYNDNDYGYKYFICYHNTNIIIKKFRTQNELSDFLTDLNF